MVPRTFDRNAFGLEIKKTKNRRAMESKLTPAIMKPLTNGIQSRENECENKEEFEREEHGKTLLTLLHFMQHKS